MVTCFELLVVNNWFVIEGGFELVSGGPKRGAGVRFFFTAVYVIGVLVCLNIVTACRLDPAPASLGPCHAQLLRNLRPSCSPRAFGWVR